MVTVGYTLNSLAFAGLLISAVLTAGEKSILQAITTNRILVMVGKYSYAAYLLHPMADQLATDTEVVSGVRLPALAHILWAIVVTISLSAACYLLIERYFLQLRHHFKPRWNLDHSGEPKASHAAVGQSFT